MMTLVMIDVEAGKEELFNRLSDKLSSMKGDSELKNIQILYLARCYTHSDISLLVDVKDPEALPPFIVNHLLKMDGVWDLQIIPLLNPKFFKIPSYIEKGNYNHFTITLDVKSDRTKEVYEYIKSFAATDEAAITFMAYSFYSYENDIIISLLSPDISQADKFVHEKLRPIDGVIDTFLWQIQQWKFIISDDNWLGFINSTRADDPISSDLWEKSYKDLKDSFICAC